MLAAAAALQGCAQLPPLGERHPSTTLRDTADTTLGRAVARLTEGHPDRSGVIPLFAGLDAFAARAVLADAAERTLDVQYYIWHDDTTGTLLFEALRRAADRGVRVRLLLDDNSGNDRLDQVLAGLAAHPNIEVRLFNPFVGRRSRLLGFLSDFGRLNRRMHNKSFTADNQVAIVGGRNVGDEYFDAPPGILFVDLDVLAIGPVVDDVSRDFDRYWASDSAYPVELVLARLDAGGLAALTASTAAVQNGTGALTYIEAIARSPFVRDLYDRRLPFEWALVQLVSDDPAKGLGAAREDDFLWPRLKRILQQPARELTLISAYFVPGTTGVADLVAMAQAGVKVTVLTNSLEATDVPAVHAGYAKARKPLLEAGVALYEMKRASSAAGASGARAPVGSSGSSLHAKTFSVDESRVFIGSFNFDPRSARLNTEMGFVIDSAALARALSASYVRRLPEDAYRVRLTQSGALQWTEHAGGQEVVHADEPGAGFWLRLGIAVMSALPVDWLL